ncbi:right-handed parallel beta-helix repeat-containing protein [Thermoplasmatota archaeon]
MDDDGGADYTRIQDAIDISINGDTIYVYKGVYRENLNINKAIKIIGEDKDNTMINGGKKGNVVRITKDSVTISNFTIQNSGNRDYPLGDCGIKLHSNYNEIYENNINNNGKGIFLKSSSNNAIYNNRITFNTYIAFEIEDSSNNLIYENQIIENDNEGMFIDSTPLGSNSNNIIIKNNISNNRDDGILMRDSSDCIINHNILSNNGHNGLDLQYSSNNTMNFNNLTNNNRFGIKIIDSPNNSIKNNNIFDNLQGIGLSYSSNIIIIDNNFSSNGIKIIGNQPNLWDTHTIENNWADDKLIRYYKNSDNIIVPVEKTAQIILAKCTNYTMQYQNLSDIVDAIQLGYSNKNNVSNNLIYCHNGINLQISNNNIIDKNRIISNSTGINLDESSYNIISNNNIINSGAGKGIKLYESYKNTLTSNSISKCNEGIDLDYSSNNTIDDNTIKNNKYEGLWLSSYSANNTITNNNISNNLCGIRVWAEFNNISNNIITENIDGICIDFSKSSILKSNEIKRNKKYGLYLEDTSSTKISYNNFIFNRRNAYFKNCENNTWDYNFWNRPRFFPYIIFGKYNSRLDFEIDWHPAIEPYDISIPEVEM